VRLRRCDPNRPGYTRRRRGKGFTYQDPTGAPITDQAELERIRALVIPPAWRDVWICPDPRGHIQAVGTDAAGRRQYRYHDVWRAQRDAAKFDHVLEVGAQLPKVREVVAGHLKERGLTANRVMAAAVRLLDVGCFRIGGEEYASGDEATFGLATLRREHVALVRGAVRFCYPAKGGVERVLDVRDDDVRTVVRALLRRESEQPELLAYRNGAGWCDVRSADINTYLREVSGIDISAKDFRTWNGTVLAAVVLAVDELEAAAKPARQPARRSANGRSGTARRRAVSSAMREVAEYLGNTAAVTKASYVDPRVVDLFCDGTTIAAILTELGGAPEPEDQVAQEAVEAAVLEMLYTGEEPDEVQP
jgi:DNA topoisomerase-1